MRLKYSFELMELEDEMIAVPVGDSVQMFHGVIKLNETSTDIFNLLRNDISTEEIVDAMEKIYDVKRPDLEREVTHFIKEFDQRGLLINENNC